MLLGFLHLYFTIGNMHLRRIWRNHPFLLMKWSFIRHGKRLL